MTVTVSSKGETTETPGGGDDAPIKAFLRELYDAYAPVTEGEVASYIPELAKTDPDLFGICVATSDGRIFEVGASRQKFTIQSASKPFTYGLALDMVGATAVHERVGVEPTGDSFNSIVLEADGRPFNPMVNAGAIAVAGLIAGADATARLHRVLDCFRAYAGAPELYVDLPTFTSERTTGHRNRAISHLLRASGVLDERIEETLDLYFQHCSVLVSARDLAVMAATLANFGENPLTGERAVEAWHVKNILSVMYTCGMYDSAGDWAFRVGLPAKSGVGGGLLAVAPGQLGIGVFSPRLDAHGNSIRAIKVCEAFSARFGLHLFDDRRCSGSALLETALKTGI